MSPAPSPSTAPVRPRSVFFHLGAFLLLTGLDQALGLRHWLLRNLRPLLGLGFVAVVGLIAGVSLYSLTQIASSTRLLINDAVTGLESTALMRPLVVELHFDVWRQASIPGHQLTMARVEAFETQFATALKQYRDGAFTPPDQQIAVEIEEAAGAYVNALQPLLDNPFPTQEQLTLADNSMELLMSTIAQGRQFNLGRLRVTAEQARTEADSALRFSYWMWGLFGLVLAFFSFLMLVFRWIGAPDKPSGGDPGSQTPWEQRRPTAEPWAGTRSKLPP
jgi:hypothetical protein